MISDYEHGRRAVSHLMAKRLSKVLRIMKKHAVLLALSLTAACVSLAEPAKPSATNVCPSDAPANAAIGTEAPLIIPNAAQGENAAASASIARSKRMAEIVENNNNDPKNKDYPARVLPSHEAWLSPVLIGLSRAIPAVGQSVIVSIDPSLMEESQVLLIASPGGKIESLRADAAGRVTWTPTRYGKHQLRVGSETISVWVTVTPMIFHWWNGIWCPQYATVVMSDDSAYWEKRGVVPVHWAGGEYMAREKEHGNKRFSKPEQWLESWYGKETRDKDRGIALDEIYGGPRPESDAIVSAIEMVRKAAGPDYCISVYFSGFEQTGFENHANRLKAAGIIGMSESYWGDEALIRKRWNDLKRHGLGAQSVLSIGPGFTMKPNPAHGPLTEAEICEWFAMNRRAAPDAPGMSFFNAYNRMDLDAATDQAIEDFFLKPIIYISVDAGKLEAQNIGNEDAKGYFVEFLDTSGKSLNKIALSPLRPQEKQVMEIPGNTRSVRALNPPRTANLYPDGIMAIQQP